MKASVRLAFSRFTLFASTLLVSTALTLLFADLMLRMDFSPAKGGLVFLFSILTLNIVFGCFQAVGGFFRLSFRRPSGGSVGNVPELHSITAINVPVYNEDIHRVLEGVRAVYESLRRLGREQHFHFYILSDSTNPDNWVREEVAWALLCRQLGARGRIFYRRRRKNLHQKAGNILNFCESWGRNYPFMVIFDADSVMDGATLVEMVRRMEADERLGILQTVPRLIRAESLYGRLQQFANSAYGPLFASGLSAWTGPHGNYWGHNAILRVEAFIQHCGLPDLPGRQPWGGKILSHDFVEAALMIRAGYKVVIADDLGGSYEEGPQDLLEALKRDRRWCQGNLQHFWLLFADGLSGWSKLHFLTGILAYASSLFWAIFLALSAGLAFDRHRSGLNLIPRESSLPLPEISLSDQGLLVFGLIMFLLLLPKGLALLCLLSHSTLRRGHGGFLGAIGNVLLETLFSALMAPICMVFHSRFVAATLFGKGITWKTQSRGARGLSWRDVLPATLPLVVLGVAVILFFREISPRHFYWCLPLAVAWAGSPFFIRFTSLPLSSRSTVLATPEDRSPPLILAGLEEALGRPTLELRYLERLRVTPGLIAAVVDPHINAIHMTLLKEAPSRTTPEEAEVTPVDPSAFFETNPLEIPAGIRMMLLTDRVLLRRFHHEVWRIAPDRLHPVWREAITLYQQL